MSLRSYVIRKVFAFKDYQRNKGVKTPKDVRRFDDIRYGPKKGKANLLDVYQPKKIDQPLPTLVNVHGGGYIYGSKNVYQYYCMCLARRGFNVINFSYRLAPKHRYPAPLEDTNYVMKWLLKNKKEYQLDLDNLFLVGDSAGAQIASQYLTILSNKDYAALFDFEIPNLKIRAAALNCGMYDFKHLKRDVKLKGILKEYLPKKHDLNHPEYDVLAHITEAFPPTFVMSSSEDFLKPHAEPFYQHLINKNIDAHLKIYGKDELTPTMHVFHLDVKSNLAHECNEEETEFFFKHRA